MKRDWKNSGAVPNELEPGSSKSMRGRAAMFGTRKRSPSGAGIMKGMTILLPVTPC